MKTPFAEIICSPEASKAIGLKRSGWILTKSGLGFENWELRREPRRRKILNLKNRDDVVSIRFNTKHELKTDTER